MIRSPLSLAEAVTLLAFAIAWCSVLTVAENKASRRRWRR